MSNELPKHRLAGLDDLRGVAALSVCVFHVTGEDDPEWVRSLTRFGFYGVYVFFVISGFILPYTMHRKGYHLHDFFRFIGKRLARLYPPYLATVGIVLFLAWTSAHMPGYHGAAFVWEWPRLLTHCTYTTAIFGFDWYNLVYWTLGIEFQYYLVIALVFPLLASSTALPRLLAWAVLTGASFVGTGLAWVTPFLPLFLLGIWAFWHGAGYWSTSVSWTLFAVSLLLCWGLLGAMGTVAAGATALAIVFVKAPWPPLRFLGVISYSLYLTHYPVLHYLARLKDRAFPTFNEPAYRALTLTAAVFVGWIFYRLVEAPSMRWASQIRYSSIPATPVPQ